MKLFAVATIIATTTAQTNLAKCHSCIVTFDAVANQTNAEMWDACIADGVEVECQGEATSCFTIERQDGSRQIQQIQMGCKQRKACLNNKYQNFWKGSECQRGAGLDDRSSKCYDCCDGEATSSCNANFATAYKAAADVEDVEGVEFENSWKLKTGKY